MSTANSTKRIRNGDLRIDPDAMPGWSTVENRPPRKGESVYCTEGRAEITRVCGKTGDGSRLLELRLLEKDAPPFFAAASNVLFAVSRQDR